MNVTWHMRTFTYPAAQEVIELLGDGHPELQVLHVGSLALDDWRPSGFVYPFDSLDLLIKEEDLALFMRTMHGEGCRLVLENPRERSVSVVAPPPRVSPSSPGPAYSRDILVDVETRAETAHYPSRLWIRFYTTRRHGPLFLVDLDHWFEDYNRLDPVEVMEGSVSIKRPAARQMLLWQAGVVTAFAADRSISKEEVEKLYWIAKQLGEEEWELLARDVARYDAAYRRQVGPYPIPPGWTPETRGDEMITAYVAGHDGDLARVERQYGPVYDLHHALDALASYPEFEDGMPPGDELSAVESLPSWSWPRKLWEYAGVIRGDRTGDDADSDDGGSLGILAVARADPNGESLFTIRDQIDWYERYPNGTLADLAIAEKVDIVHTGLPTHGPWHDCTEADLRLLY